MVEENGVDAVSVRISVYRCAPVRRLEGCRLYFIEIVVEKDKKRSRKMSFARPSTKLRSIERHQPSPPLSQRKGEGKRLVLIVAGPAEYIFVKSTFSWNFFSYS